MFIKVCLGLFLFVFVFLGFFVVFFNIHNYPLKILWFKLTWEKLCLLLLLFFVVVFFVFLCVFLI